MMASILSRTQTKNESTLICKVKGGGAIRTTQMMVLQPRGSDSGSDEAAVSNLQTVQV